MKILHIISSGGMYGAEAVILNVSRTLNRTGHSAVLGIFSNSLKPNLQVHECALDEGIESHLISCRGQFDTSVPASIRALAASTGADVVHAHGYKADVYAYLAMRRSPTPLVSTCHNWLDDSRAVRFYGELDRWILRRYQAVIAVSQPVRQTLLQSGIPAPNIHLIGNGIDLRPFLNAVPSLRDRSSNPDDLFVGWIGRLSNEKGPDIFIRVAADVHREFPSARFILVGDGPDRASLEALIDQLGLADIVRLVGRRTDMPAVYASFDVMVSSSRLEGLPMAILEGMASGLPWVATAVGDVPAIVQNDLTGIVVASEDASGIASGVATLLGDAVARKRMGAAGKLFVEENFTAEQTVLQYLQVYETAMKREQRSIKQVLHA